MFRASYLARKAGQLAITLFAVVTFNFVLFRVLPGDPLQLIARSGHLPPDAVARLKALFGLDRPLPVQYWYYCPSLGGYYPNVPTCPESWVQVPPRVD